MWDKHFCSLFGEEEDALASHEGEALPSPAVSEEGRTATAATQPRQRLSSPHAPRPQTGSEKKRLREAPRVAVGAQQEPREAAAIPWAQGEGHRPGERPGGAGTERRARRGGGSVRPPRCSPSQLGPFPSHGVVGSSRCWKRRGAEGVPRWPGGSCGVPLKAAGTGASQGKEIKRERSSPTPTKSSPLPSFWGAFPAVPSPAHLPFPPQGRGNLCSPPRALCVAPKPGGFFFPGHPLAPQLLCLHNRVAVSHAARRQPRMFSSTRNAPANHLKCPDRPRPSSSSAHVGLHAPSVPLRCPRGGRSLSPRASEESDGGHRPPRCMRSTPTHAGIQLSRCRLSRDGATLAGF